MKQSKIAIIVLACLVVLGWFSVLFAGDSGETEEYQAHLDQAEKYVDRTLYQKAIEEYDAALALKNTQEVWSDKLEAYRLRYEESTDIYNDYLSAAQNAVSAYAENPEYLLTLVGLYLDREEYTQAYKALEKAVDAGMEDEKVQELYTQVKYAYQLGWKEYAGYVPCVNGYYAVNETGVWTYITEDGGETDFAGLVMAGPVGESGVRVVRDETRSYLVDDGGVVQGILSFEPEAAGVYAEGLIALERDGSFAYYDSMGDEQFGDYAQAGTFVEGEAAVQQGDAWFLIDAQGNQVSEETYEDIVLYADGTHKKDGLMIAKQEGVYRFYKDGETFGEYEDADIVTADGMVAVCKDGKWGYVNLEGEELIAPAYAEAKSFSNGLAAVSDGKLWGFIDTTGQLVIDYTFYGTDYFNSQKDCMVETREGEAWQLLSLYNK